MRGFTLLELILAMAILVSFLGLGLPAANKLIAKIEGNNSLLLLQQSLNQARSIAQSSETYIAVCPISNSTCVNNWQFPITIFNDLNLNNKVDAGETIIKIVDSLSTSGYWIKNNSNQPSIRFNPLGHAFSSASTLLYCPYSYDNTLAVGLITNFQGRIQSRKYLTSRGKIDNRFSNLNCISPK